MKKSQNSGPLDLFGQKFTDDVTERVDVAAQETLPEQVERQEIQEKELEIAFNIHYLISVLEKLSSQSVNMVIPGGENKSCLLSATDDESYQYIIMPMRI